jgi:protein O-mannosyl-transferase
VTTIDSVVKLLHIAHIEHRLTRNMNDVPYPHTLSGLGLSPPMLTQPWCVAVILSLLTALLFLPAITCDFVVYDDAAIVYENPVVSQGLTAEGFIWAWQFKAPTGYCPLTLLSHMLDVQLWGLNPAGHHLTNVILHALTTAMLFLALRRLTKRAGVSAVATLLFAVHPLRVESVVWVAERKDVLSGLFFALTLYTYASYASRRTPWRYALVTLWLILGLLSKPMLVTTPAVLLLLDYWPLRRWELSHPWKTSTRKALWLIIEKLPWVALACVESWLTVLAQRAAGAVVTGQSLPLDARLSNAVVSVVRYLGKTFWPTNLSVFYPHPGYWPTPIVLGSIVVVLALSIAALWLWRKQPWWVVGWLFFLGTLIPVIGIVQVGNQAMADRYTYIPCIGLTLAICFGVATLLDRHPAWRRVAPLLSCLLIAILSVMTLNQTRVWANGITLFRHAIAAAGPCELSLNHLAIALGSAAETGKLNKLTLTADQRHAMRVESAQLFEKALSTDQGNLKFRVNLATALIMLGRMDEAHAHLKQAMLIDPDNPKVHANLATVLSALSDKPAALRHAENAAALDPTSASNQCNLGLLLSDLSQDKRAVAQLRSISPAMQSDPSVLAAMGVSLARLGELDAAATHLSRSLQSRPEDVATLFNAGNVALMRKRPDAAVNYFDRAIAINPNHAAAHNAAGLALAQMGQIPQALTYFEKAVTLKPDFADALRNRDRARAVLTPSPAPPAP